MISDVLMLARAFPCSISIHFVDYVAFHGALTYIHIHSKLNILNKKTRQMFEMRQIEIWGDS